MDNGVNWFKQFLRLNSNEKTHYLSKISLINEAGSYVLKTDSFTEDYTALTPLNYGKT